MAAADGLTEFVTPYSTSDFKDLISDLQAFNNAVKGQAEVVAHDLRRLLPRAQNVNGRAGLFGIDLRIAAVQVSRQFTQIAAAHNAASAAAGKALTIYIGNFTSTGNGTHGRNSFDAGK